MKWKRFDIEWDGLDRNAPDKTIELLEMVSAEGYVPRFLERWRRNSVADDHHVVIYAEKREQ